jgi:Uma2 family endonuclease
MLTAKRLYTVEEYFALEDQAEQKHEYYYGEIIPMAGATFNHIRLVQNITGEFLVQFKRKNCEVFSMDLKVQVKIGKDYTYPDVVALCGKIEPMPGRKDAITNPSVIMEVLSKSTQGYDKTKKFERYKSVETMQEYILVRQNKMEIICYRKQADNTWKSETLKKPEDVLQLDSVNAKMSLVDVYDKVDFSLE